MDGADDHDKADELAKKTAKLSDEQRQEYEKRVNLTTEARGSVTDQYRLDIVSTLLQGLPAKEQGRQINEAARREEQRAYPAKQLGSEVMTPGQDGGKRQLTPEAQKTSLQQQSATRDYSELRRTHEQVAAKQGAERGATSDSATALLSKEQLQGMAERYAETRKAGNLEPTQAELRQRADSAKDHATSQEKLDHAHGATPNAQQKQERALLDHQQLAERVGTEGRMIGQQLRKQGNPGAEAYERESRSAFHTARAVHEQRQNLGAGVDLVREAARVAQQQDQQKQSAAQEAARGGSVMTSEQRANASPNVKQSLDRKERAEAVRATGTEGKFQSARPEIMKPGNVRSGGRSR